ncbi:hypothetical protein [Methyloglobulus sp.]
MKVFRYGQVLQPEVTDTILIEWNLWKASPAWLHFADWQNISR